MKALNRLFFHEGSQSDGFFMKGSQSDGFFMKGGQSADFLPNEGSIFSRAVTPKVAAQHPMIQTKKCG